MSMQEASAKPIPFDTAKLDAEMEAAGIDILLVNSKHNLSYLLDRHRHHFFEYSDAIGVSRYLPLLVYRKGRPDQAAYFGNRNEKDMIAVRANEGRPLWPATIVPATSMTLDATARAVEHIRSIASRPGAIGIEPGFLPFDAGTALREAFPDSRFTDATRTLEQLRAIKTPAELEIIREASERVVQAMVATMRGSAHGCSKHEIISVLQREEIARGLAFEYALITLGTSLNRAPSSEIWRKGDIMSVDSGGNLDGYLGDLCRMAVAGEPDSEARDLLAEVRAVQDAARKPIRDGLRGGDIFAAAEEELKRVSSGNQMSFVAHGVGLIGHEAPRLTAKGPIPYPADDADLPLKAGMVISVETTLLHPKRGFIKLEDTVAVTATGHVGYGDDARDWVST